MKYYRITGRKNKNYFINLEAVLWVEFIDEEYKILFNKGINDVLHLVVEEEEYSCIKDKLVKALVFPIQEEGD
ncbi:MAG: hypothetical protein WD426_06460 [Anditalea sp.]